MRTAAIFFLSVAGLCAQPLFDVASVRPSGPYKGPGGLPWQLNVKVTPNSVTIRGGTLKACVSWAYEVMEYQVTGPEWLNSARFDIVAKTAEPAEEEQLRKAMQALLTERFKLELHKENKTLPAWVLSVAKGGFKLKESATEGDMSVAPQREKMQVVFQRAGAGDVVYVLSNVLRTPVIDETGLKGKYDVTIDVAKYLPEMKRSGEGSQTPLDPIGLISLALREEAGIKMESKKVPLDYLVVDRAEKVPVEN